MDLFSSQLESMYPFLSELSEEQRKAATHMSGPSIVLAGAGSGKTHTLCYKIKYLMATGISPRDICAVTFSSKAAEELQERMEKKHGITAVEIRTFHSLGNRLLRQYVEYTPYRKGFKLIKDWEIKNVFFDYLKKTFSTGFDWSLLKYWVSMAKKNLVSPENFEEFLADKDILNLDTVAPAYGFYEDFKRVNNLIDFDDMIYVPMRMLMSNSDIRSRCEGMYSYGLIDEGQDNNLSQFNLVQILVKPSGLSVIADDFQSIYGFQGARPDITIFDFHKKTGADVYLLSDNYRSDSDIIAAANNLSNQMDNPFGKRMNPKTETTGNVTVMACATPADECEEIAHKIFYQQQETGESWDNFAVLYRVNAQSRNVEEALMGRDIPYIVIGGISFFNRKEVKDIMAYYRLAVDGEKYHYDLRRALNIASSKYPSRSRKIGNRFFDDLLAISDNLWKALKKSSGDARVADFWQLIKGIQAQPTPGAKIGYIIDNCYLQFMTQDDGGVDEDTGEDKTYILDEIRQAFSMFTSDEKLISHVYAMQNNFEKNKEDHKDKVKVMTIHKSKGLEWESVFIISVNNNYMPHIRAEGPLGYQEERRIAYVAATRARKSLHISFSSFLRMKKADPSPFIAEMGFSADGAIAALHSTQVENEKLVSASSMLSGD